MPNVRLNHGVGFINHSAICRVNDFTEAVSRDHVMVLYGDHQRDF